MPLDQLGRAMGPGISRVGFSRSRRRTGDKLMWASRANIGVTGVSGKGRSYLSDFYTTLIDIQWRWNLLFFVVSFVVTWLGFAVYYFLLCFLHGDLDPEVLYGNVTRTPCVENVHSFTEAYLFSIETMSTIGYGWRHQTEECPGVILAVMLQSVIGAGLQFALASLVVSKTRRANRRSQTILFSNEAVIYREEGELKLAVRIGDMRKGDVFGAHATAMLIKKTTGKEGHKVPVRMFTVQLEAESGGQKLFLCWPCLLVHRVDQNSPLWRLSQHHLLQNRHELIVVLDGVAASTSKPFQARKSYHSREMVWGRRFQPLQVDDSDSRTGGYTVDFSTFHLTEPAPTSPCSAQTLARRNLLKELHEDLDLGLDLDQEHLDVMDEQTELRLLERILTQAGRVGMGEADPHSPSVLEGADSLGDLDASRSRKEFVVTQVHEGEKMGTKIEEVTEVNNSLNNLPPRPPPRPRSAESSCSRRRLSRSPKSSQSCRSAGTTVSSWRDFSDSQKLSRDCRVVFQTLPNKGTQPQRRVSLGDMVNMYRHRRSVTDTYLGTELQEEESDDSEESAAISSIVSQQSMDPRPDVRDVFTLRRKSTTFPLVFGGEDSLFTS